MSAPAISVRPASPAGGMYLTLGAAATYIAYSGIYVRLAEDGPPAPG